MRNTKKEFLNSFFLVIGYAGVFFAIQFFLFKCGFFKDYPHAKSLLAWDAAWYYDIVKNGYKYWEAANNTGFYIFFPAVWRLSHLDPLGISCLNVVIFAFGFSVFTSLYKLSAAEKLVLISIPSMFYMFVPYAEALFFLFSVVCLYGIVNKSRLLIWLSLFLLAITRANAAIFFPVFLLAELLTNDRKHWLKTIGMACYTYGLPLLLGTALFVWYQYQATGIWFVYFKVQSAYWDRKFQMPTFPLGSGLGATTVWLNALALFLGFLAFLITVKDGLKWLMKNRLTDDKVLLISKLYLTATLFLILFFNPTWNIDATNVFGAHRYAFAGPFAMVFLVRYTKEAAYSLKDYLLIFILGNLFWLLFSSYEHILSLLYFNFNSLLIVCYMLQSNKKLIWPIIAVIAINIFLQISIFQQFIAKVFVD